MTPISDPTVSRINVTSAIVAPPVEKPVDVLTKSAPAFWANWQTTTFSWSVRRQASIMTFTNLSPLASTTARISDSTKAKLPDLRAPTLITISISSAPFWIASFVSNAFTAEVVAPKGKPTTVQTLTSVPSSPFLACSTQVGLTQTLAKPYSLASDNKLSICFFFASCFKSV
ncbi:Uncharacterised protein [Streptococcus pneumoniae]|nr:Uncharacterised protein [Streptococcus pneumoniae]